MPSFSHFLYCKYTDRNGNNVTIYSVPPKKNLNIFPYLPQIQLFKKNHMIELKPSFLKLKYIIPGHVFKLSLYIHGSTMHYSALQIFYVKENMSYFMQHSVTCSIHIGSFFWDLPKLIHFSFSYKIPLCEYTAAYLSLSGGHLRLCPHFHCYQQSSNDCLWGRASKTFLSQDPFTALNFI